MLTSCLVITYLLKANDIDTLYCYGISKDKKMSLNKLNIKSIDLHSHSIFSDGRANLYQIEEKSLKENFSVVLTDHNEIRGSLKLFERGRIITLPALEAGTKEGLEFLIYFNSAEDIESFYKRAIEPYKRERFMVQIDVPTSTLLNIAKDYNCFISMAHPFGFRRKSINYHSSNIELIKLIYDHIDAVETFNGNLSNANNNMSKQLHQSVPALKSTVGSDAHDLASLGQVTADFKLDDLDYTSKGIFDALVAGKFVENTPNKISKLNTAINISLSHTKYYFDKGKGIERDIKKSLLTK